MITSKVQNRGFTMLIAIITASIVLAIGISILNITLKEFTLSSTVRESSMAFYAADAGMECAQYWDQSTNGGKFEPSSPAQTIACMGSSVQQWGSGLSELVGGNAYGTSENFQMEWGTPTICARVTVTKYYSSSGSVSIPNDTSCLQGTVCTVVQSRGYNRSCSNLTDPRAVERALRSRY